MLRPLAAPAPARRPGRLGLIGFGVVAIGVLALSLGADLWLDYTGYVAAARHSAEKLTLALDEHARAVFESVDGVLRVTAGEIERAARRGQADDATVRTILERGSGGLRQIHSMSLRDADGRMTQFTLRPTAPMTDTSRSDYFYVHRDGAASGGYIGKPIRSQVTGEWMIPVSRRLNDPDGRFAGVLVATVPLAYFAEFFRSLQIGPHGVVTLLRTDGTYLVREPDAGRTGQQIAGSLLFDTYLRQAPSGVFQRTASTDGFYRIYAYRAIPSLPLVVTASIAVDDALAEWYRDLRVYFAIWLACSAVIAGFTAILVRQAARRATAEQVAQATTERFQRLVGSVPGCVFQRVLKPDGKIGYTFMGPQIEAQFGHPAEAISRDPTLLVAAIDKGDRAAFLEKIRESAANFTPMSMEMRVRHPNGERRWIHTMSTPYQKLADGTILWDGLSVDVTDRKNAELASQRSQAEASRVRALLADAIESINGGFVLYDAEDRLVMMNRAAREWHPDFAAAAVPGAHHDELIRTAAKTGRIVGDGDDTWAIVRHRLAWHRQAFGKPIERQIGDRWYQITEFPTSEGGVVVLRTDITELKKAYIENARAMALADRANRAKSEFLAMMSHELRTPLNAILGFSEILRDHWSSLPGQKASEYAADVHSSGTHLLNLINDVLDLSKAEAGKMDLQPSPLIVGDIVDRSLRMVRERATVNGVRLEARIAPGLPPLVADERRLIQVLLNLLSNSVKFTPRDGTVTVSASREADGALAIRVADTGIGIAKENIERALSTFGQVDNLLTRQHNGTGLGLPLAKRLTELHGASFDLESTVGVGTTVTLRFPAQQLSSVAA